MPEATKDKNIQVTIREVGPREGVQSYPGTIETKDKIKLIQILAKANFDEIEITAMVRPDRVPAMADSEEIIKSVVKDNSATHYSALYLNDKGFERAVGFTQLKTEGWLSFSVSETFLKKNNNLSFADLKNSIPKSLELFNSYGKKLKGLMVSNCFGCHAEGIKEPSEVIKVLQNVMELCTLSGLLPEYIMLADTTGMGTPKSVADLIKEVRNNFKQSKIGLHLHDTMGLGIANAYVGLQEGVDFFDASIAGVGGCPFVPNAAGNIATEELVYLCESMGLKTGIDKSYLNEAVLFAKDIFKDRISSKLAKTIK